MIDEDKAGQISDFMSLFGFDLALKDHYYTFSDLIDAPNYSIAGGAFLGAPTTVTFSGQPWEVMRENELVYDFSRGLVVPIQSILKTFQIKSAANYFLSSGLILPGSVTDDGSRVKDYAAFFLFEKMKFKYSEVGYD
jgi:hypothetical protein